MIMPEYTQTLNRYSYCLNNPLMLKDPTGQKYSELDDIWDFDVNGNFIKRTETTEFDQIRIWNKDRTRILAESKQHPFGTFENTMSFHEKSIIMSGIKHDLKGLEMNFGENYEGSMIAFKFLAEHTDPTEWHAFGRSNFKGGMDNLLFTTHRADFEYFGTQLAERAAPQGGLFYDFHSHDKNSPYFPSDKISNGHPGDREFRYSLIGEGQSPGAIFGILQKGVMYDYRGQKMDYLKLFK